MKRDKRTARKTARLNIRLDDDVRRALDREAERRRTTPSELARECLHERYGKR